MELKQVDIPRALDAEVQIDHAGKKLWVNVDGVCVLRIGLIDRLVIVDQREGGDILGGARDTDIA